MISPEVFRWSVIIWIGIAIITFPFLYKTIAPFGRHTNKKMGPLLPNRLGWILMESPAVWWFTLVFFSGPVLKSSWHFLLFSCWMIHYLNRVLIFPFRTRTKGKKIPLAIMGSAFFFQLVNGFFVAYSIGWMDNGKSETLLSWNVIAGISIFVIGFIINQWADTKLINLRKPGETGYKIPRGGLFEWITCPNFFGEIMEWCGFALMCLNLAGLSFAIWTIANLVPRAWAHHKWYKKEFPEYPEERKIVIPFVY